jgi:short-subunit dehydrogenase
VTGASAGIGAEFARALAREGISCVLTARRLDRLRDLGSELEKTHQVATRIVSADLSDPEGADRLAQAVRDLDISILVNNAGFGYSGRFDGQDPARLRQMVQLNCVAPVVLTGRLLPGMLQRGRGAIVITGSVAGRQPLPLHGVYAATKAFDLLFGEALAVELERKGIDVLVVEPGSTETEFQEVAGEIPHSGESPEQVVRVALDALGRQPSVVSGWFNWLRANAASRLLPRSLVAHVAEEVMAAQTPDEMR